MSEIKDDDLMWDDAFSNDLTPIAIEHLEMNTLEERGPVLDVHLVSIYGVRKALMAAWQMGYQAGVENNE